MRRESIPQEYPVHIMRRGGRGLPFARDDADKWRNLQALFYLNDSSSRVNWFRDLEEERSAAKARAEESRFFSWPASWPKQEPLISLCAFAFVGNHDHFLAYEVQEGGVSRFMQKINISTAKHFNEKYGEKGTVFQGSYKVKVIDSDRYLRWVAPYVMVKNTFEMHPRGYTWAVNNFERAWEWAAVYAFSSLGDYAGARNSPVIESAAFKEILGGSLSFKKLCRDMILGRERIGENEMSEVSRLSLEDI